MKITDNTPLTLPEGYADWLVRLKGQLSQARQRAALAVNVELVQIYGRIGRDILRRQQTQGWGAKVIDHLARDLKDAFPDMCGWSSSNLKYVRFLPCIARTVNLVSRLLTKFHWFHIVTHRYDWGFKSC